MRLCVDRIESRTVVLVSDGGGVYRLMPEEYIALVGAPPVESDVLTAEAEGDRITAAVLDEAETQRRRETARNRLNTLFGKPSPAPVSPHQTKHIQENPS